MDESCRLIGMTKRMQVLFEDEEYRGIQRVARECHMTVAEWVRQSLREARMARRSVAEAKLRAVDEATRHSFPVGDIEMMLREIEAGRLPE
ncbi:MAG: hypothetical protein J4F38_09555 [Pseudomonadales bacterium]|nr:hypothetical protein [Pseudomonadales bacterium]